MSDMSYMEKLLDGEKVEWLPVAELFYLKNGYTPSKSKKEFWEGGSIPWFRMDDIRQNGRLLNDSLQKVTNEAVKGGKLFSAKSLIFATSATIGEHALITVPYLANQRFTNLTVKEEYKGTVDIKYLYYYGFLLSDWCKKNTTMSSFASVDMDGFRKFKIPIPCPENPNKSLAIQAEIVRILDAFTALTAELTARKKQYNYYRDKLLTFDDENKYPFLEKLLDGEKVEWLPLGEIATVQRGASPRPIAKYITNDEDGVPWIKIGDTSPGSKYVRNTAQKITKEGAKKSRLLKKGDFIISNSMSFGRPYILKIDGAIHDGWASISAFEKSLNSDFLYHYLSSNLVQNYWLSKINSGSVSNLNADIIKTLEVPIPCPDKPEKSLAEQARIVDILDKFDALTNSISEGLPREIELRNKQYEYYRDLLLNFPKPEKEEAAA